MAGRVCYWPQVLNRRQRRLGFTLWLFGLVAFLVRLYFACDWTSYGDGSLALGAGWFGIGTGSGSGSGTGTGTGTKPEVPLSQDQTTAELGEGQGEKHEAEPVTQEGVEVEDIYFGDMTEILSQRATASTTTTTFAGPAPTPAEKLPNGSSTTMAAQTPAGPQSRPYVVLPQGTYIGITVPQSYKYPKAFEAFRGIPYAQDTSGQNRFRPPQPLPKSSQTFDARFWGPVCPSGGVLRPNMSENCLNLNVYRPAGIVVDRKGFAADGKHPRLPVAVYIHGGAFNWGHGGERNMGSFISWNEQPMISVVFNYRIGALGFLPSNVTEREGLLNLGLRDQQMLLEWVQENIEAFGGDPNNVTIIGLSAGAHSIGHHIMHYARTKKPAPFHKAILESGATTARAVLYPNHPRHETQFREFLAAAGASHVPEAELFPYLRNLPLETIMRASNSVWNKYTASVTWPFQPVIDGPNPHAYSRHLPSARDLTIPVIPDLPIASWLAASHLRIPIITGYNTNEGTNFIPQHADTPADFRNFFKTLIPSLTEADLAELDRLYPDPVAHPATSPYVKVPKGFGRQWARLDAAYSHYAYICPVLQTAHFMTLAGVENVYVYRYAAVSGLGYANHGDEAAVVSHDVDAIGRWAGVVKIADEMCSRWGRFVVSETGDVNRGIKDLNWPKFVSPFSEKEGAGQLLVFGEGNNERAGGKSMGVPVQVRTLTELEKQACKFWWERVWLSEGMGVPRGGGGKARL